MDQFMEQDLTGARFERVSLRGATFREAHLTDAEMRSVDLTGLRLRDAYWIEGGSAGWRCADLEISGELERVGVNGVDVAPLIEAELDRRMPQRVLMRAEGAKGFAGMVGARAAVGGDPAARDFPPGGGPASQRRR